MAETDFIVAIELGSSKITGIAGRKESDGSIHVLAYAKEDSSAFIRKGVVYNIDKTAQCLTSIVNKLEDTLRSSISQVYVGIGGQSIRTIKNIVSRHFANEEIISQELIDSIIDENIQIPLIDMDILDVVAQEYKIGINQQADPIGVLGSNIEGRFLNVVARSSVKKNLQRCFEIAKIEVADYYISPIVAANVILTDSEKRTGCALVDFGADTTTISVYKNNILRYLTVLPLGGNNITNDICTLQMEEEDAEYLKVKYGNSILDLDKEENDLYQLEGSTRTVDRKSLEEIIEARVEEIVANVWYQVELSGYQGDLMAGIIITGGGSNLKNIDETIKNRTKVSNVKIAKFARNGVRADGPELLKKDGTQLSIIGLLNAGKENCCMPEIVTPIPPTKPAPAESLFVDEELEIENTRKKIAEEKKRKEEEEKERKRKEKEKKEAEKLAKGPSKLSRMFEKITSELFNEDDK